MRVNALRARYTYVFTTGGIGPTHDDITADCVAKAFGVPLDSIREAVAILQERLAKTGGELNEARMRMARIPRGADAGREQGLRRARLLDRQRHHDGGHPGGDAGDAGRGGAEAQDRNEIAVGNDPRRCERR